MALRAFLALLLLLLLIALGVQAEAALVNRIVAVVNGEIVTSQELEDAIRDRQLAEGVSVLPLNARREVLDTLVEDRLIAQRATELGLAVDNDDIESALKDIMRQNKLTRPQLEEALRQQGVDPEDYKKTLRRQILRFKVVGREVQSRLEVSNREVRDYYDNHSDSFRAPPTVHLKHLGFPFTKENESSRSSARRHADDARSRLDGGSTIDELIAKGPEVGGEGGDIGTFRPDELSSAFAGAIAGLAAGACSQIVESGNAFHILCVVTSTPGQLKEFDAVKDQIRSQLGDEKKRGAQRAWLDELKQKARIELRP